jgi:hypothetical protein
VWASGGFIRQCPLLYPEGDLHQPLACETNPLSRFTIHQRLCSMTIIIRSEDCGNSPKNMFVENIEIAIAKNDPEFLLIARHAKQCVF